MSPPLFFLPRGEEPLLARRVTLLHESPPDIVGKRARVGLITNTKLITYLLSLIT